MWTPPVLGAGEMAILDELLDETESLLAARTRSPSDSSTRTSASSPPTASLDRPPAASSRTVTRRYPAHR